MKRIPEKFVLDEKDIKKAIAYWLNNIEQKEGIDFEYDMSFDVVRKTGNPPIGAPIGGMGDYSYQEVIVTASKKEPK